MKHRIAAFIGRAAPRGRRPGAVLAVVAVSLVALVSVIALAIDIGMLYSGRTEAQRVADAAALAGASAFLDIDPVHFAPEASAEAQSRAMDYATRGMVLSNQVEATEVETQILIADQRVRVYIRRDAVPLIFARIFGVQTSGIKAMATAEAVYAGSSNCVKPFAIPDMWGAPAPGEDIYATGGSAPIWDFDAHLNPTDEMKASDRCRRQGNRWVCDQESWDVRNASGYAKNSHGYGSKIRDNVPDVRGRRYLEDQGRKIPLKINSNDPNAMPSYWFPWRLPGSSGASDLKQSLKGCVGDVSVGDGVVTETGMMSNVIHSAIIDLIDNGNGTVGGDKDAYWDEQGDSIAGSAFQANIKASPRVITVAVVDPMTLRTGMNTMTFVDFATFFLEDPRREYPDVNPAHHAPITGRLMKWGSGDAGPEQGSLIKRLRLVE